MPADCSHVASAGRFPQQQPAPADIATHHKSAGRNTCWRTEPLCSSKEGGFWPHGTSQWPAGLVVKKRHCDQPDNCLQAAFPNTGLHQQHLDSAAHKKALAKQERDREQAERMSRGRDAAENAVVRWGCLRRVLWPQWAAHLDSQCCGCRAVAAVDCCGCSWC